MGAAAIEGIVFDIKEFTVHDGPGIRTTVFLKGCPLRCIWCHNPEGLSPQPQLMVSANGCKHCGACRKPCNHPQCQPFDRCILACPGGLIQVAGQRMEAQELAGRLQAQREFFEGSGGGVTVSGGEPLMQPDFLCELLERLAPLHRIVETSGYAKPEIFRRMLERCDAVYLDIKHPDDKIHKEVTGVSNQPILENLRQLKASGRPYNIRIPLIPGINDDKESLSRTIELAEEQRGGLVRIDFMPYNSFAGAKYEMTGMPFRYEKKQDNDLTRIPYDLLERYQLEYKIL